MPKFCEALRQMPKDPHHPYGRYRSGNGRRSSPRPYLRTMTGGAPRRLAVALFAVSAALLLAPLPSSSADDIYDIDGRLQKAGFADAYTEAFNADGRSGVRLVIDFDSESADSATYRREAEQAAEVVWDHLEGRVLAIDVAPTFSVPWNKTGLPTAVSYDRAALMSRFGPRPARLDKADIETVDEGGDDSSPAAEVAFWLVVILAVGATTFLLTRARYRQPATPPPGNWGSWTQTPIPPSTWSQPPQTQPPGAQPPAPTPAQPTAAATLDDPWRPLM